MLNYVGYDNVYVLANASTRHINSDVFPSECVLTNYNEKNLLLTYKIDDVFSTYLFYTFFGGTCTTSYFSIMNRVYEHFKHVGIGHYYHIQDDSETAAINPILFMDFRDSSTPIKFSNIVEKDEYYNIKDKLTEMFDNIIVLYCGINYNSYYNSLKNSKNKKLFHCKLPDKIGGWTHFGVFNYMCVNSNIDEKLKDYDNDKKFDAEYHGYVKSDSSRVKTTLNFYNAISGDVLLICGKKYLAISLNMQNKYLICHIMIC